MWKLVLAVFLAAHGLIHLGYITPAPADPNYPFKMSNSWLIKSLGLPEATVRPLGTVLTVLTVIGFLLAGLAAVGIIVPQDWGLPLTVVSGVLSILLLVVFWHTWLVLGVGIDLALIIGLVWLGWQPFMAVSA